MSETSRIRTSTPPAEAAGGAADALALAPLLAIAAAVAVVLIAFAHGYGYHRDELYFLVAGDHLAASYPDQGPLTPFIAHLAQLVAPGSLTVLRLPSALMTGATVLVAGLTAFELGGTRRAQLVAAACTAVATIVLGVGHLLSTTTFDLLAWALVLWLAVRIVRTGEERLWLLAGAVCGLALLNKPLIVFLLAALAAGVLACGPRRTLRSGWLWGGVALAVLLWLPWLVWQAHHGWPQLSVSSSIASGGSSSSQPRWALLPFQLLLVSPVLAPVWIAGLIALLRRPRLRPFRFVAAAWLALVVIFLVAGGKPYYLAGMFPALLAAGAIEADAWLERGTPRRRFALLTAAIALSGVVSALIALPLLPARDAGVAIAADSDVGETIGWPALAQTVARVYRDGHARVIFTANYGEAGAVDRFGPALGLPRAFSGHNGFGLWGVPPGRSGPVVVVGLSRTLDRGFSGCQLRAWVDNPAGVDNDERGEPVVLCAAPRRPWSAEWRLLRHLS